MKTFELAGLVGAGSVSLSFLARIPSLHACLGPVKGATYPSARRLAGILRTGYAVKTYADLGECSMIWVFVPESQLSHVIQELADRTPIQRAMVVLCGTDRDSRWAEPLRRRGARVATLNALGGKARGPYVAEGHPDTLRRIQKMLGHDGLKVIEIRPAAKELYLAGVHLITDALRPWVTASMDALRAAGFERAEALAVVEAFGSASLREHGKAGATPWSPGVEMEVSEALQNRAKALRLLDPNVAGIYEEGLRMTLRYFRNRGTPVHRGAQSVKAATSAEPAPPAAVNH